MAEGHSLTKAAELQKAKLCATPATTRRCPANRLQAWQSGVEQPRRFVRDAEDAPHLYEKARSRRFAKDAILRYQGMLALRARAGQAPPLRKATAERKRTEHV